MKPGPAIPARTLPMRGIPAGGARTDNDADDHPRMHALSIAAATHLNRAGHLPAMKKAQIHARAKANLKRLRGKDNEKKEPAAFGSLAPDMDEDAK